MHWSDHAIWWQVYPLGFLGAPIRERATAADRTLRGLVDWLDYLVNLGANGLLLGPIFAATSHGYDTLDHFQIDPRLGNQDDWDALVAACRQRGIRICLDGVFNHVGVEHAWVQSRPEMVSASVFEGHPGLVELNHANPDVADYVVQVMNHWLERGADAWRLDAAYATNAAFWTNVLPRVRATHPDVWVFGEVIHGDYPDFVARSGVDSVTQYQLWKAIWSSLKDKNFFELEWALRGHNQFLDTFVPQTFVGNHDVTRIASQVGAEQAILAMVILLTVAGVPSIYYGDEQGFTATKQERLGGDDDIRPAYPVAPTDLIALGAWVFEAHQRLIGLRRRHPWLTHARTETVELTNERFVYRCQHGDEMILVELELAPEVKAVVTSSSATEFTYRK